MLRLAVIAALLFALPLAAAEEYTLYQQPTLSRTAIAFVYAGDLFSVPREGGKAVRLTTHAGVERHPHFSPDGTQIAFTGEYDGNVDVFVMPAQGGVPQRLTFHPGDDEVVGWASHGQEVLFRSARSSVAGHHQLFCMGLGGGLPALLPLPLAFEGSLSPDGKRVAYQHITQWQPDWKRPKGGQNGKIWLANLENSAVEVLPSPGSNDINPVWVGHQVYFVSDRESPTGTRSIFAYDVDTKQVRRVLKNDGLDVKSMSAGPDALVYEQFGKLFVLDPTTGAAQPVAIEVDADFESVRPRFVTVGDQLQDGAISPTGARAVFAARGEILTVPSKKGDARNLTRSPGTMERDPAWSPDGKWIAYFSDASGEYALHLQDQKGSGEVRKIVASDPSSFYYNLVWSPDSKKLAYADRRLNLWYVDIDERKPIKIDTSKIGFTEAALEPSWSPDSAWIAWSKRLPNLLRAVFVHSLASGKTQQLTDGMSDVTFPTFDKNGKYLYIAASTDIGRGLSWADLSGIDSVSTRNVYAVVLRSDLPSPFAPESDEENAEESSEKDSEAEDSAEDAAEDSDEAKPEPVRIDFEGIDQRILALPMPGANISALAAGSEGILFVAIVPPGHFGTEAETFELRRFDLATRKADDFLSAIDAFDISANGEKVLYHQEKTWFIAATADAPDGADGALATEGIEVWVEPRAEWRQMFHDAWLGQRDHFYDENHHGLDIAAARKFYEPYLRAVAHRADLSYLFGEMLNQLTVGHMFIFGGDLPATTQVDVGLLGCDFKVENGLYRFARIYDGENWNANLRAPLTAPGVGVKEGEYLLAVDGRSLDAKSNVYAAFENKAEKQVVIRVGSTPDGKNARDVKVVPVADEAALRQHAWIEDNRRKVDELSGGQLAYIYIPDTAVDGYSSFNRYFFSQTNKKGAVIDDRFNGGGLLADYVVNYLTRPQLSAIAMRYAETDIRVPAGAIQGPKAMLINSMAGSGGDAMPWYFRKMNVGPLIGTRTWGGLVASIPGPRLMDGGGYTAPDAAVYGLSGAWEVENEGVAPDIEVELDPAAWRKGRDTQLERAVSYLLGELEKNPRSEPQRPVYPKYERCCGLNGN